MREAKYRKVGNGIGVGADQKHPLPRAAHQAPILAEPVRDAAEPDVVARLGRGGNVERGQIDLTVRPVDHRYCGAAPGEVSRTARRMQLDRSDALGRNPEILPGRGQDLEKSSVQIVRVAEIIECQLAGRLLE